MAVNSLDLLTEYRYNCT